MNNKITLRAGVVGMMIVLAAFSRLIPHMPNFSPLAAMALFSAAHFQKKWIAFIIPLLSLWLSDLVLNNVVYTAYYPSFTWFYPGFYWQYGSLLLIGFLGFLFLNTISVKKVLGTAISASLLFFLISNFGVWLGSSMYPQNFAGLITCYVAGVPFLKGTLIGDLFYTSVLFGVFALLQHNFVALKSSYQARF